LYRILKAWQITPAGQTPAVFRGGEDGWIVAEIDAVRLLDQVLGRIVATEGGDPEVLGEYGEVVEKLARGVFTEGLFAKSQGAPHIDTATLLHMRTLGLAWEQPAIPQHDLEELRTAVAEARDLVANYDGFSREVSSYLFGVINSLERALAGAEVDGCLDVHRLANELNGALAAYFASAPSEALSVVQSIQSKLMKAVWVTVGAAASGAVQQVGGTVAALAIGAATGH
jgi:hypothetical protein